MAKCSCRKVICGEKYKEGNMGFWMVLLASIISGTITVILGGFVFYFLQESNRRKTIRHKYCLRYLHESNMAFSDACIFRKKREIEKKVDMTDEQANKIIDGYILKAKIHFDNYVKSFLGYRFYFESKMFGIFDTFDVNDDDKNSDKNSKQFNDLTEEVEKHLKNPDLSSLEYLLYNKDNPLKKLDDKIKKMDEKSNHPVIFWIKKIWKIILSIRIKFYLSEINDE